jgi:16S rRNA G966 N2-methylase RsmD
MTATDKLLYGKDGFGFVEKAPAKSILHDRFVMPPFSVWDTKQGKWQDRKQRWINWCGIRSEAGRDDALTYNIPLTLKDGRTGRRIENQTSVFDPVLCELAYSWWCPAGGKVLDPFAGGSVRGIVASMLGLKYMGIDLRAEQVEANRQQATPANTGEYMPRWRCGDSHTVLGTMAGMVFDFMFSCPPYGCLEKYSDDPRDISNMTYEQFMLQYSIIISRAAAVLRDNAFAVWVVGNYRAPDGTMHDLVGDTIRCFTMAGMAYYNDIVLLNATGTAPMRSNTSFLRGHGKVVKLHQNVLVFVKGDPALVPVALRPPKATEEPETP